MVRVNSPGICTAVKSRARRVRRSLSRTSLDVHGAVVMEKVWMFEGMTEGLSMEHLSEEESGNTSCQKHTWFLFTNLLTAQQCAKCSRRILPKRAAYKCTACKRLCHLKCVAENSNTNTELPRLRPRKEQSAMDFKAFVPKDGPHTCRYAKKTSTSRHRSPYTQRELNNNVIEEIQYGEELDLIENDSPQQVTDLPVYADGLDSSRHSQAKQKLTNMKHGIVKKCRSFRKKVKTLTGKVHITEGNKQSNEQVGQESTTTTTATSSVVDDEVEQEREAWVRSPVRTRLRERRLELRRESLKARIDARRNNSYKESSVQKIKKGSQMRNSRRHRFQIYDLDLETLNDRLTEVEKRVSELETAIPQEIDEWYKLQQKFCGNDAVDASCKNKRERKTEEQIMHETHPKHLEAMGMMPSVSSGTTSDDVYIVPDQQTSSSPEDEPDHVAPGIGHMSSNKGHTASSHSDSIHEDSLPSGIPGRLRMDTGHNISSKQQTSTPVTEREMSFLSASRRYKNTHQIQHTNITQINVEHSYCEPNLASKAEIKLERSVSFEKSSPHKVLSPEQLGVKSFLQRRRTSSPRRSSGAVNCHTTPTRRKSTSPCRSSDRKPNPFNQTRSRSNSPLRRMNQSCIYNSPPIASSTFQEDNFEYRDKLPNMSPLSYTFRHDPEDNSRYTYAKVEENSRLDMIHNGGDRNTSSASNFSYTFRNDSQMIQTNAEDDLQGYTRNCPPLGQLQVSAESRDTGSKKNFQQSTRVAYQADVEMDPPVSQAAYVKRDSLSTQFTTSTTDDGMSLTNVTTVTGDFINSFSETVNATSKSRWVNKDVYMFDRAERGNPVRSRYTQSHERVDATGDWRKPPPVPGKRYSSSSEIDFLKEAEKRLEVYKIRQNREHLTAGVCLEKLSRPSVLHALEPELREDVKEHIVENYATVGSTENLQSMPGHVSPKQGSRSKQRSPSPERRPDLYRSTARERGLSPERSSSPYRSSSPKRSFNPERSSSPKRSQSPKRSSSPKRTPSPKKGSSPKIGPRSKRTPSSKRSLSPKRSPLSRRKDVSPEYNPNTKRKNVSPGRSLSGSPRSQRKDRSSSPNRNIPTSEKRNLNHLDQDVYHSRHTHTSPKRVNSTAEFEDFERQLQEDSLGHERRSVSLTSLQRYPHKLSNGYHRGQSVSCTNSIDGETRSLINESARYHFLHDKGMIKISSPSLKILNGSPATKKKYEPECKHIDEESSDLVLSGSESGLSGIYVDNNFHLQGKTSSEMESKQTHSDIAETLSTFSQKSDRLTRRQVQQEHEIYEQCLKTADSNQEVWDHVLDWINKDDGDDDLELEHELDKLMHQDHREGLDTDKETDRSPIEDSVYYSFPGQSGELRGALSPLHATLVQQRRSSEIIHDARPGLMYVICNGSVQDVSDYLNSDQTISEGEIKEALLWALDQKNYEITLLLLEDICKLIHGAEDDDCIDVFPAYLEQKRWQPVFVILTKQDYQGDWDSFMGFPVYRRRYDLVSTEEAEVVNSDYVRSHQLSLDDFRTVRRAVSLANLQKYHRKITVINACPCRSKKGGQVLEKGLCIVVHCLIKGFIPFDEEPFPREIRGIPVDVREGYFRHGGNTPTGITDIHEQCKNTGMYSGDETMSKASSRSHMSECRSGSGSHGNNSCMSGFSSRTTSPTNLKAAGPCDRSPRAAVQRVDSLHGEVESATKFDQEQHSIVTDEVIDKVSPSTVHQAV